MNRTASTLLLLSSLSLLAGCTTTNYSDPKLTGVPGWVADGAQIAEPPKLKPDPNLLLHNSHSGPIGIGFEERVETPEQAAKRKKAVDDLFNR